MDTDDEIGRALVGAWHTATDGLTPPDALVQRAVARGRRRVAVHRVATAAGSMSVAGATVAVTTLGSSPQPPARTVPAASASASTAAATPQQPTEPTPPLDDGWVEATLTPAFVQCLEAKGYKVGRNTYDPRVAPAPAPDTEFSLLISRSTKPAWATMSDSDFRASIDADAAACRAGG